MGTFFFFTDQTCGAIVGGVVGVVGVVSASLIVINVIVWTLVYQRSKKVSRLKLLFKQHPAIITCAYIHALYPAV